MTDISKLTKDEMVNYLYVRDIIRGGDDTDTISNINYTNIMLISLPFIMVLILILVLYLVYKQYYRDDKKSK
jgi:predicted RND superfamily exporter protein